MIRKKPAKKKIIASRSSSNIKTKKIMQKGFMKQEDLPKNDSASSKKKKSIKPEFRDQSKTEVRLTRQLSISAEEPVGFRRWWGTECHWRVKSQTTPRTSRS